MAVRENFIGSQYLLSLAFLVAKRGPGPSKRVSDCMILIPKIMQINTTLNKFQKVDTSLVSQFISNRLGNMVENAVESNSWELKFSQQTSTGIRHPL